MAQRLASNQKNAGSNPVSPSKKHTSGPTHAVGSEPPNKRRSNNSHRQRRCVMFDANMYDYEWEEEASFRGDE